MNSKINKFLEYFITYGIFAVLLVPIIFFGENFFPFITSKAYVFRIVVECITAAWIILVLRDSSYKPKWTPIAWAVTALTVFSGLSSFFGVDISRSIWSNYERMEGWITIIHLFAYFVVVVSVLKSKKLWNRFFLTTLAVSTAIALWGMLQISCAGNFANSGLAIADNSFCIGLSKSFIAQKLGGLQIVQGDRLNSTLGNAAYYAVYTLINIFIALFMIVRSIKDRKPKIRLALLSLVAVLNVVAMFFTATRATMIGLVIGLILSGVMYVVYTWVNQSRLAKKTGEKAKLPKVWYAALGVLVIGLVLLITAVSLRGSDFVKQNRFLNRYLNISFAETQTQARAFIWPMAIKGFEDKPILGWGQENFVHVFNKYYDPRMWAHEQWFDRAHNIFLDWLVSGGIIGFLAYLALYLIPLVYILFKSKLSIPERAILLGLWVAYGIHNMSIFDNLTSYILFFSLLAYINLEWAGERDRKPLSEVGVTTVASEQGDKDVVTYIVTPIVLIALIATLYFVNIRSISVNRQLIVASSQCTKYGTSVFDKLLTEDDYIGYGEIREQLWNCSNILLSNSSVPVEARTAAYTASITEVNNQLSRFDKDARVYFFAGNVLLSAGNFADAQVAFAKASDFSPNKPIFIIGQANALLGQNKTKEAMAMFKKAYDLAPEYPLGILAYSISLINGGDIAQAVKIASSSETVLLDSRYASALYDKRAFRELIPIMERRIKLDPSNIKNYTSLAALYLDPSVYDRSAARKVILSIKDVDPTQVKTVDETLKKYGL